MSDSIFTLDDSNNAAIRTVMMRGISETNKKDIFTEDEDGNAAIRVVGSGGGSSVDYTKVVSKTETMPVASEDNADIIYLYEGETDANYTQNYIYKNVATPTYSSTVEFNPASLSSTTATCSGDDFAAFVAEYGTGNITDIIKGTITYDQSGGLLVFVGKDDTDTTVCTFQLYTQDYEDAGFAFTGTLQDGDVITFSCDITESATYAWVRIDVQPQPEGLPSQTGNAGKFLTTDGTDASWSDKPLVNTATGTNSLTVGGVAATYNQTTNIGVTSQAYGYNNVLIGYNTSAYRSSVAIGNAATAGGASPYQKQGNIAIGYAASSRGGEYCIAIGYSAKVTANNAIQISATSVSGNQTNSDANTFKVGNANGNYEIMSADGTIPAARHASLPATDGTYVLKLVIADGVPTLSWVAE